MRGVLSIKIKKHLTPYFDPDSDRCKVTKCLRLDPVFEGPSDGGTGQKSSDLASEALIRIDMGWYSEKE